jgi:exoribonuclease-2
MHDHRHIDLRAIAFHAMEKYGFEPTFPMKVVQEIDALDPAAIPKSEDGIRDLRPLLWSSIDNDDTLDFDQLEYCERGPDGEIHVKVAIADVDAYVRKDSATDLHAAYNGTSVYTGVETFPMLPDKLSKGISSLLPGHDRRAVVIEYAVLPDGSVRGGEIYQAIVRNRVKLVYEEIGSWLEEVRAIPQALREIPGLDEQLLMQHAAAQRLRKHRMEQGALDLDTIEAQPVMEDGSVKELVVQRENHARHLIEEFMVAANGVMVARLGDADVPMIQRVVRIPRYWDRIVQTAADYGERLPAEPNAKALADFLVRRKVADPEVFPDLSLTVVKLLGPGEYMMLEPGADPVGHFSLAVTDYTHATAPNRRYVDVVNQRLLKSILAKAEAPYSRRELVDLSEWLTDRDKSANKVERFMRKSAAAVLLRDRIGESFEAIVTGASEKGTYVRLFAPPAEGRVVEGERGLLVGQKVTVRLKKTDPYNGHIDFERLGGKGAFRRTRKSARAFAFGSAGRRSP